MKKLILLLALVAFNFSNAQGSLTLDKLNSGANLTMTATPNSALGTGGTVEIYGNLLSGRIMVTTGVGSSGHTACRINFPSGNGLGTDEANIFIRSSDNKFFFVDSAGVDSTGFDIYAKDLWNDNTSYEFRYTIISHVQ